jgi:K+-sensing histidine kinase KdpD
MRIDPVLQAHRPWVVAAAAVVPLVACSVLALFRDDIANTNAALGLVLLVVGAAATGIRAAGIVAALSSAAGFDFFLTEPYNTFTIADRADIETAVLLLVTGAAVGELSLWGRREQSRASLEQGYLNGVAGTAAAVAAGQSSTADVIAVVCRQITQILRIDSCRFDAGNHSGLPTIDASGTVSRHGRAIDVSRHGLPTDSTIALAVRSGGVVHGQFLLTASTRVVRPSREQLQVAVALADQVGAALANTGRAGSTGDS